MSWLNMSSTGRAIENVFHRGGQLEYIEAGETYHRVHEDHMEETAEILLVAYDPYGIPMFGFMSVSADPTAISSMAAPACWRSAPLPTVTPNWW